MLKAKNMKLIKVTAFLFPVSCEGGACPSLSWLVELLPISLFFITPCSQLPSSQSAPLLFCYALNYFILLSFPIPPLHPHLILLLADCLCQDFWPPFLILMLRSTTTFIHPVCRLLRLGPTINRGLSTWLNTGQQSHTHFSSI